jgi:alkylated DNA repair dioxygenase AlkB
MPRELSNLSAELARLANDGGNAREYVSEAVIVNFYHPSSTICGHVDDAERCFDAPIVSISIGLDCIFLIGGLTRVSATERT